MVSMIKLSIALLATALVLSSATASGGSPFCSSTDDKVLCNQLVHGAHTWPEAMTNVINAVLVKAKAGKHVAGSVSSKLPRNLPPVSKDSIASACKEGCETIVDNLKQCLGFVKNDPTSALKFYLSAVSFTDCTNALDDFGLSVPEVTQFANEMDKLTSTLLAVADKKP